MTTLVAGQVILFIDYRGWHIPAQTTRIGLQTIFLVELAVACFTILMLIMGTLNWLDYRREEVELTDAVVGRGFRRLPQVRNWYRWYESYVILFVALSVVLAGALAYGLLLPRIR